MQSDKNWNNNKIHNYLKKNELADLVFSFFFCTCARARLFPLTLLYNIIISMYIFIKTFQNEVGCGIF